MRPVIRFFLVFLVLFSSSLSGVIAEGEGREVVTNSLAWQDVYSAGIYAALKDHEYGYVIEQTQSFEVIQTIDNDVVDVILINPETNNLVGGFKTSIEARGVAIAQELTSNDYLETNLALAQLADVDRYILVDDTYGYNAISVGPYAVKSNAYVLFVNDDNVQDVIDQIEGASYVMLYGPIERDAEDALDSYVTERVDEKGKYRNNLVMLDKISELEPLTQVLFTDGAILEHEIMDGFKPVMFIGTSNIPDGVIETIEEKRVEIGIVVGVGITDNARLIREQTGIQIFVKFAKGINDIQKALDIFPVDVYDINLTIENIVYNLATNSIELSVKNGNDNFLYSKFSIQILKDGEVIATLGSDDVDFISGSEQLTKLYELILDDPEAIYTVNIIAQYGEDEFSLERLLQLNDADLEIITDSDDSEIRINSVQYNFDTKRFEIEIDNLKNQGVFVLAKLNNLIIDGEEVDLGSREYEIDENGKVTAKIRAELEPVDIEDNEQVSLTVLYGEESGRLIKIVTGTYDLELVSSLDYLVPLAIGLAVVLVLLVISLLIFGKRRRGR